jgi:cysteine synthase
MPDVSVKSVLSLIGNTPLVRVGSMDTGPCELFLKLESPAAPSKTASVSR